MVTLQQHTQSRPPPQQQQQQSTHQPSSAPRASKPVSAYSAVPPTAGVITASQSYVNYGGGVYPVDGEGLVERLEEISLLQEEGKEGQQEPDNDR